MSINNGLLRWGICSVGKISNAFQSAMSIDPKNNVTVACAARDLERAQEFANRFKIPRAYGSYDELAKDAEVEIVYIGCIHDYHMTLCELFLNNGKHVLCEKPLTMNAQDTKNVCQLAKEKGLFLMEAFWNRCCPVYEAIRNHIKQQEIGEIKSISVTFSKVFPYWEKQPMNVWLGVLYLIGCYTVNLVDMVYNLTAEPQNLEPISIKSIGEFEEINGIKFETRYSSLLLYPNNKMATIKADYNVFSPNEAIIGGTKGWIKVEECFHIPTKYTIATDPVMLSCTKVETKTYEIPKLPASIKPTNHHNSAGLLYEIQHVYDCVVKRKLLESSLNPHAASVRVARITDEIRRQVLDQD